MATSGVEAGSASVELAITLLCSFMKKDNRAGIVTQWLREQAARLPEGSQLPSAREIQQQLRVSPLTVRKAVAQLSNEGIVDARPGHGTFVRRPAKMVEPKADASWQTLVLGSARSTGEALVELVSPPSRNHLTLSGGYLPSDLQPRALLTSAMIRAARTSQVWEQMPLEGLETLRAWFARELHPSVSARDVIICPGSQAAVATSLRALTQFGDSILMESPTYVGALSAAQSAGLRVIPIPTDEHGVIPDALQEALRQSNAKVFYCQPTHANPTGTILSQARRTAVYECICAAGAFLIEDDWARDLSFDGHPPPPLMTGDQDGHVLYIRSLTKPAAASMRIAALVARGAAHTRLKIYRATDDLFVAGPLQEAAYQVVTDPAWLRHLRTMRRTLRERRDAMVAAVKRTWGASAVRHIPSGGFHLWVRLPEGTSSKALQLAAARAGIVISAGDAWFPAEPTASYVRLTFAIESPERIQRGVALLGKLLLS